MKILISSNLLGCASWSEKFTEIKKFLLPLQQYKVGVEIFPMFHEKEFEKELNDCMELFEKIPVSFHSQYYDAEYDDDKGSEAYERTMEYFKKTLLYAKALHSSYIVFHHNNSPITGKSKERLYQNAENMLECMNYMGQKTKVPIVIENAGVKNIDTMLLDQEEFISTCKKHDNKVLIDIGHAHANGWDLEYVMEELKDKITAYHLHNNDGEQDLHQRIFEGTLDFENFLRMYQRLTPDADLVLEYSSRYSNSVNEIIEDAIYLNKVLS